ncbi:hypothetical protein ABT247_01155 [Kitasatospora sp. NPDC001539]|uniref:hypothetical protein n=1 Tax=Kitasatospora sp. NPDC001539 TaxID=3154384 RepID=UPI00331EB297
MAAASALVSGLALASAPAARATPTTGPTASVPTGPATAATTTAPAPGPAPHGPASPLTVTTTGFPTAVPAGGTVEFGSTLRNTADHQLDVTTDFVVATFGAGVQENQLHLQVRKPGSAQWQDATLRPGSTTGARWDLDPFATELHLAAGAEAAYGLRLTFAADATPGQASAALTAVVTDPTLPPEQRVSQAFGGTPAFTVVPVGGPSTPAPVGLPDVKVEGMPAAFTAGGGAKTFTVVYGNRTGTDLRVVPAIVFQGEVPLRAAMARLEFRTQAGAWVAGTPGGPDGSELPTTQLEMDLRSGSKEADVLVLPSGQSRTVELRLAWTADTPATAESILAGGYSLAGPGGTERGASSPKVGFRIEAAAPSATTPPAASQAQATGPTTAPAAQITTAAPSPEAGTTQPAPGSGARARPAAAPAAATDTRLATTGGTPSSAPMAITGAMAIALGLATLIVARRRNATRRTRN